MATPRSLTFDPVTRLCFLAAMDPPEISGDRSVQLPSAVFAQWLASGLVEEIEPAGAVHCPECLPEYNQWLNEMFKEDGFAEDPENIPWADVHVARDATGTIVHAVARCPRTGHDTVIAARSVRRWRLNLLNFAHLVARTKRFGDEAAEIVVGRLYRLGRATDGETMREVYLARGLTRAGGEEVVQRAALEAGAIDLVVLVVVGEVPIDLDESSGLRLLSVEDLLAADAASSISVGSASPLGAATSTRPTMVSIPPPNAGKPSRSSRSSQYPLRPVTAPPGTRWGDVQLRVGDDELCVVIGTTRAWRRFDEAGFANRLLGRDNADSNEVWKLLQRFARSGPDGPAGHVLYQRPKPVDLRKNPDEERVRYTAEKKVYDALKASVGRLRKALCALIPEVADEDPITATGGPRPRRSTSSTSSRTQPRESAASAGREGQESLDDGGLAEGTALDRVDDLRDDDDPSSAAAGRSNGGYGAYRTTFAISALPEHFIQTPSGAAWEDVSMGTDGVHLLVRIVVPTSAGGLTDTVASPTPDGPSPLGHAPEQDGFPLLDLDLGDSQLAVLDELLRTGVVVRGVRDGATKDLCRILGSLLGLDADGLRFRRTHERWEPVFRVILD